METAGSAKMMCSRSMRMYALLFCMVLCMLWIPQQTHAASQPRLNKTTLKMITKKSKKLKVKGYKGKVQWWSSNTYVATVSKKGKVKAKHMGYAVIFAQCQDVRLMCCVTVSGRKREKPYIFCYETDREGKTVETGGSYNLAVMNGYDQTWKWTVSDTEYATLYDNGNHVSSAIRPGRYCQLVETFMGKAGTVLVTATNGTTTLYFNLVIHPTGLDYAYTQLRSQVQAQVLRQGMTAQEKCLALAKWLSDYASYVITNADDYSLLVTRVGQCYHYARTYDFLMEGTGIPCEYVCTLAHAWNQVLIDGAWYNIDVTSFDTDRANPPYNYRHFMISDSIFWRREGRCQPYHPCVSTRYDFQQVYNSSPWVTGQWKQY